MRVIIIGGGLGGLFTAALLAHNGVTVEVFERNAVIGGGLQTFVRHGLRCETGMHVLGGFQQGGTLHRICRYLGILDRLDIHALPSDGMAHVRGLDDGIDIKLPQGREAYTDALVQQFPSEADAIRRYVAAIYAIAHGVDLYNLRPDYSIMSIDRQASMPVGAFLDQFTHNASLQRVLACASLLYDAQGGQTPAYVHALISVLYINGSSMFGSSSQQLADVLAQSICRQGGTVHTGCPVTAIQVCDRQVSGIVTADGAGHHADAYVSSLHPLQTIRLCTEGAFPRIYVQRLQSIHNSTSAFKVYYEVQASRLAPVTSPVYLFDKTERLWHLSDDDDLWPQGVALFVTQPGLTQRGTYLLQAVTHLTFDAVRCWSDSYSGHRPQAYLDWKQAQTDRVTQFVARHYEGFTDAVVSSFAASPLTFRDWLDAPRGSIYGFCADADNVLVSHLPVRTKVHNLLLTGQSVNLHGICGVPLTAIQTAEAILGQNTILDNLPQ